MVFIKKYKYNIIYFLTLLAIFYLVEYITFLNIGYRQSIRFWKFSSLSHLFSAIVFVIPYFFLQKKKVIMIIPLLLLLLAGLSSVLYFRTYLQFIPLSSLFYFANYKGLANSILSSFKPIDLLFLLPVVLFMAAHYFFSKKIITESILSRLKMFSFFFLLVILTISLVGYQDARKAFTYRDAKSPYFFDQFASARHYGLFPLWLWQISTHDKIKLSPAEIEYYRKTLFNGQVYKSNSHTDKPNIILIITESLESWVLNATFKNKEITPELNSLLRENEVFFAPNVKDQTMTGRSSDAKLIINCGLLPVKSGATSFKYQGNTFLSLPKALEENGYSTAIFCAGSSTFWNYFAFASAQGFQHIASIEDYKYTQSDIFQFGLKDSVFFAQTFEMLNELEEPYFAELITLSSHQPFDIPGNIRIKDFGCDGYYCEYLHAINYTDRYIGEFMKRLIEAGKFKNTIIIITSDHLGLPLNQGKKEFILNQTDLVTTSNKYINTIPLIILNSHLQGYHDEMINQVDIYSTLIELFAPDYKWHGLGKSVTSYCSSDPLTNDKTRTSLQYNADVISDSLIRGNFFRYLEKDF